MHESPSFGIIFNQNTVLLLSPMSIFSLSLAQTEFELEECQFCFMA